MKKRLRINFKEKLSSWIKKLPEVQVELEISKAEKRLMDFERDPFVFTGYGKDLRTDWEKAYDLIESWFFEEIFYQTIKSSLDKNGLKITHNGCDSERVLYLPDEKIRADSDFLIFKDDKLIKRLELKTLSWMFKQVSIKKGNAQELKKKNASIVVWDLNKNEIYNLKSEDFKGKKIETQKTWGGKECYIFTNKELIKMKKGDLNSLEWIESLSLK